MPDVKKIILLLELSRAMDRELARGISRYARLQSSSPWSFYSEDTKGRRASLPRLKHWGAHGIIAHNPTEENTKAIIDSGLPAIVRGIRIPGCPHISSDPLAASKMAADHFIERGFRAFAYCGYDSTEWSQIRKECFVENLQEFCDEIHCFKQPRSRNWYSWEKEQPILAEWLKGLPKPISLFACNDDRARHVIEACKLANIYVPEEVAVLGVDNDEHVCELSNPPISSIAVNSERAGATAAKILDQMMTTGQPSEEEIVVSPTHIITRQSTNILAIQDPQIAMAINFIRRNSRQLIQVNDVVEATHLSRRALEKRFKTHLKRSILEEIHQTHISQIAQMLIETNLTISKIAHNAGYPSSKHLARSFRKVMGASPLEYRKKLGNK
jgi:LacI family transcriptional regulator